MTLTTRIIFHFSNIVDAFFCFFFFYSISFALVRCARTIMPVEHTQMLSLSRQYKYNGMSFDFPELKKRPLQSKQWEINLNILSHFVMRSRVWGPDAMDSDGTGNYIFSYRKKNMFFFFIVGFWYVCWMRISIDIRFVFCFFEVVAQNGWEYLCSMLVV